MTLLAAHKFIAATRENATLRESIAALGEDADLDAVADIGRKAGFAFDAEELRNAWRQDCALQRIAASAAGAAGNGGEDGKRRSSSADSAK